MNLDNNTKGVSCYNRLFIFLGESNMFIPVQFDRAVVTMIRGWNDTPVTHIIILKVYD